MCREQRPWGPDLNPVDTHPDPLDVARQVTKTEAPLADPAAKAPREGVPDEAVGVAPETLVRAPNGLLHAGDLRLSLDGYVQAGDERVPPRVPAPVYGRTTRGPGARITADDG